MTTGYLDLADSLMLLHAAYSRTFGVCGVCPHGSHLTGMGTKATTYLDFGPPIKRMMLCEAHHSDIVNGPADPSSSDETGSGTSSG